MNYKDGERVISGTGVRCADCLNSFSGRFSMKTADVNPIPSY